MFNYKIFSNHIFSIDEKVVDSIFKNISKTIEKSQKWTINIIFEDDSSIQILNKKYRNIDKSTDVLSFHYYEDFEQLSDSDTAWEIVFSTDKIISQWEKYWLWSEKEFYKLLIHSILHILWYDHENDDEYLEMKKFEDLIWWTICCK